MNRRALGVIAATWLAGCGDNSKLCGTGTDDLDDDGECEASEGTGDTVCGAGTRLDPISEDCVPDATACGDGLVLVNGRCQDPTAGLDLDLVEGPEPNGLELDATPAGLIVPEAIGADGFVLHGCIQPLDNATPDLDRYLLTVTEPTLLRITADGVQGLAAGFFARSASTSGTITAWHRLGLSVATDVARRQVWLPEAGTYELFVSDARTLAPLTTTTSLATLPAAGDPDGTSCYYLTIDREAPVPAPLATTASGMLGTDLAFFTATGLTGTVSFTETISSPRAQTSPVIMINGVLAQIDDDGIATVTGVVATDELTFVADFVHNSALFEVPFQVSL